MRMEGKSISNQRFREALALDKSLTPAGNSMYLVMHKEFAKLIAQLQGIIILAMVQINNSQ